MAQEKKPQSGWELLFKFEVLASLLMQVRDNWPTIKLAGGAVISTLATTFLSFKIKERLEFLTNGIVEWIIAISIAILCAVITIWILSLIGRFRHTPPPCEIAPKDDIDALAEFAPIDGAIARRIHNIHERGKKLLAQGEVGKARLGDYAVRLVNIEIPQMLEYFFGKRERARFCAAMKEYGQAKERHTPYEIIGQILRYLNNLLVKRAQIHVDKLQQLRISSSRE